MLSIAPKPFFAWKARKGLLGWGGGGGGGGDVRAECHVRNIFGWSCHDVFAPDAAIGDSWEGCVGPAIGSVVAGAVDLQASGTDRD